MRYLTLQRLEELETKRTSNRAAREQENPSVLHTENARSVTEVAYLKQDNLETVTVE